MFVQADLKQFVGEVKERNRFNIAISKIRDIAFASSSENISDDVREQFMLIVRECDNALKPKTKN